MKKERKMALSLILPPIIFVGGVFIYLFVGFLKEETNLYYYIHTDQINRTISFLSSLRINMADDEVETDNFFIHF